MMRGKVRGLLPGKYGGTGVKEPEIPGRCFMKRQKKRRMTEESRKNKNRDQRQEKITGMNVP